MFDSDPEKNPKAALFSEISYGDVLTKNLRVMDLTAITLCRENSVPIIVFNMNKPDNLLKIVTGESVGTSVGHFDLNEETKTNKLRFL